jgi:hypothetical protein
MRLGVRMALCPSTLGAASLRLIRDVYKIGSGNMSFWWFDDPWG